MSPCTRARTSLLGLIVVPRTPVVQAAKEALSLALLALVVSTQHQADGDPSDGAPPALGALRHYARACDGASHEAR